MKTLLLLLTLSVGVVQLFAGDSHSDNLLKNVILRLDRINDYTADILIKIDVDFLKIGDTKASVYFKKPDKFKMEARGFAMIPKASFSFSPLNFLQQDFLSVYIKEDTLDAIETDVIKLIPVREDSKIILATLWIDKVHSVVLKTEANTKDKGSFRIRYRYGTHIQYGLPDTAVVFFDISKSRMSHFPMGSKKLNKGAKGSVEIIYTNYKINKGLDDSVFEEESEEETG